MRAVSKRSCVCVATRLLCAGWQGWPSCVWGVRTASRWLARVLPVVLGRWAAQLLGVRRRCAFLELKRVCREGQAGVGQGRLGAARDSRERTAWYALPAAPLADMDANWECGCRSCDHSSSSMPLMHITLGCRWQLRADTAVHMGVLPCRWCHVPSKLVHAKAPKGDARVYCARGKYTTN